MADCSGCTAQCATGCGTSCEGGCTGGCKEGCTGCTGSCEGKCYQSCENTCENDCLTTCDGNCFKACEESCFETCNNACFESCKEKCYTDCKDICKGYCQMDCQTFCESIQILSENNQENGPEKPFKGKFSWSNSIDSELIIKITAQEWNNLISAINAVAEYHPLTFPIITDYIIAEPDYPKKYPTQSNADIGEGISAFRYNDLMRPFAPEQKNSDTEEYVLNLNTAGSLIVYNVVKDKTILKPKYFKALKDNYNNFKMS